MGKAIDLPDPLESTASRPLGNADDLLAQLAGEEVDRLLAEADADGKQARPGEARRTGDATPPSTADIAAAVTGPPPPAESAIGEDLNTLFTTITGERAGSAAQPGVASDTPASPAFNTPAAFAAEQAAPAAAFDAPVPVMGPGPSPFGPVDSNLPDDINANEVMAAILGDTGSILTAPPLPPAGQAIVRVNPATAPRQDLATTAAERHGLAAIDPADELPGPGELELLSAPVEPDGPLPAYLKPLEWMNAPLDLLPTPIRDVIGQVAILTLINAIAVLIYVFVFRKS